jgi:membrane protein DedA with SNARE-associated domain
MILEVVKSAASHLLAAVTPTPPDGFVDMLFDAEWNVANAAYIMPTIVVALFLAGVGLPLPEDIPLTLTGFTTYKQSGDQFDLLHYAVAFCIVTVPILLGDMCTWYMGRRWGFELRDRVRFIRRALTDKRMRKVQGWFDHYGNFTVFLGRQVAGVRFVTFFSAGAMRMSLSKFMLFDFLGCLVSVPVWLLLGGLAARHGKEWLDVASKKVGSGFLIASVLIVAGFYVFLRIRSARRAKAGAAPTLIPEAPLATDSVVNENHEELSRAQNQ